MIDTSECQEYFDEVLKFAIERGLKEQLEKQLNYLDGYSGRQNTLCKLYPDHAPHSFNFVMHRDGQRWFNGGLIFQSPDCPADGSFPTLTVSLAEGTGWFVHT